MKATQNGLSSTELCSLPDLPLTPQFQGKSQEAYSGTQRGAWEGGHPLLLSQKDISGSKCGRIGSQAAEQPWALAWWSLWSDWLGIFSLRVQGGNPAYRELDSEGLWEQSLLHRLPSNFTEQSVCTELSTARLTLIWQPDKSCLRPVQQLPWV